MDTICATNYAHLFVGFFEKNFVFNPAMNSHLSEIIKWCRFIDDIFCIYNGTSEELADFVSLLNSFSTNLEFTSNYSNQRVSFLNMWVMKNNSSIITTLYQKDTDKNTLLPATSFHPTPLKRGLPVSQFFRLSRISIPLRTLKRRLWI